MRSDAFAGTFTTGSDGEWAVTSRVAKQVENHPWGDTPLGPRSVWDPALRGAVDLILACPTAMALVCGDEGLLIYNDAFVRMLGTKHPDALGLPTREVFREMWDIDGVGDVIERVHRTGESFTEPERQLPIARGEGHGPVEHALFARSYSPVRSGAGDIVAILAVITETTSTTRRLQSLVDLTSALAAAVTLDDVVRTTARCVMEAFDVDHFAVAVAAVDGPGWQAVRRVRSDVFDDTDERLPPLWRRMPADSVLPIVRAATTRSAWYLTPADLRKLHVHAVDRHDKTLRALAALPLEDTIVRGAVTFGYVIDHAWSVSERAQLAAAARLIGQALERAQRYDTQHGASLLLQRSLLPDTLPNLDDFRLAARYDTGVDGNAAGGDFYDAFETPDGMLAIALGDVAGHDMHAAAVMGQVRAALRAFALIDPAPQTVLHRLDQLMAALGTSARREELFTTVVYGVADPRRHTLTVASAGHIPPLVRRTHHDAAFLPMVVGPPLGLGGTHQPVTCDLEPGLSVVLFSDGAVERRDHALADGLEAVRTAVAAAISGEPRNLCALVATTVPTGTDDDVAVLALERATEPSRTGWLTVGPEATAPAQARRWITRQLSAWGVAADIIDTAALCVSELVTNALLHAGTTARISIDLTGERLLIAVTDTGSRGSITIPAPDNLSSRGRGLHLITALADAWGTDPTIRGSSVWLELLLPPRPR
jgi:serine phosphatase RsbU (regulator of sigma subunit)